MDATSFRTRDQYHQALSLEFARWLGLLAENHGPDTANRAFVERYPHSVGTTLLKKNLEFKAAVGAGTSTDPAWANPLVAVKPLQDGFVAIARSASLLGRIPGLRKVPFSTKIPLEDTSANYSWVAENAPKPISKMAFSSSITLAALKHLGIIVVSRELVELAVAGMESALRDTLVNGLTAFTDKSFLDPASTAVANTRPASVTAGTTPITATASYQTDVASLLTAFFTARPNAQNAVLITNAGHASLIRSWNGGGGVGLPVLVSDAALGNTIAMDPAGVFVADDGVDVDVSDQASIQMNDAPDNPPVAATVPTSLWQLNLRGFKVERFVNWAAVTGAVKYLAG